MERLAGTRGKNTRDSVSWTGTVPVPTVPGTRFSVRRCATLMSGETRFKGGSTDLAKRYSVGIQTMQIEQLN